MDSPEKIKISLTTFLDFVSATGPARITVVRKAKQEYKQGYSPARDYYRQMRLRIIDMHQSEKTRHHLDEVVATASKNKTENYLARATSYVKWMGRKELHWVAIPPNATWVVEEFEFLINPELYISISDTPHLIKLYFKAAELSKAKVEEVLCLLHNTISLDIAVGVLDVRRGKLHTTTRAVPGLDILLEAEARAFLTMWRGL